MAWAAVAMAAAKAFEEKQKADAQRADAVMRDGGGGGPAATTGGTGTELRSINIAPVGLNLGSIISPFTQGSPENGGAGLMVPSRMMPGDFSPGYETALYTEKKPVNPLLVAGLGIGGALLAAKFIF